MPSVIMLSVVMLIVVVPIQNLSTQKSIINEGITKRYWPWIMRNVTQLKANKLAAVFRHS